MLVVVLGKPEGKARPRVVRNGNFTRSYTPENTVIYENLVKMSYKEQDGRFFNAHTPLCLGIKAYYPIPASYSKKKTDKAINGDILPLVKPDLDNVAKIIMDALNGIAYADDKQIVRLYIERLYGARPRVEFSIKELDDNGRE